MNAKFKKVLIRKGLILAALMIIGTGLIPLLLKGELEGRIGICSYSIACWGLFSLLGLFKYEKLHRKIK